MNRKEKIALLNSLLKGEKPMACIFDEWPEKTYYEIEIISLEEVDYELNNYPKVRIIYDNPAERDNVESEVMDNFRHKYLNEDGEEVEIEEDSKEAALFLSKGPPGCKTQNSDPFATGKGEIKDSTTLKKLSNPNADTNPEPPQDPKPPPEPFLSRKDREVMAQGPLYCVR